MPLLADEDLAVSKSYGVTGWRGRWQARRARGVRRPLRDAGDLRRRRRRGSSATATSRGPARPSRRSTTSSGPSPPWPDARARGAAAVHRRRGAGDPRRGGGGGAADRPLPRDHRDPPLRRPRLAGAGARRPHRRHLRRPRPRRVRSRPGRARVMDTRSWSATWRRWSRRRSARSRFVLAGHSMGAHTAVAYALRASRAPRRPGRRRPGLHGRDSRRRRSPTGTASPRRSRRAGSTASSSYIDRIRGSIRPGATRSCASPASGCCSTATRRRSSRRCARCRARGRSSRWRSWSRSTSRLWSSPATTPPTPAIPTRSPQAYAEHLPQARLISEAEGESPLAWQGGRLSREIAAFCAALP